MQRKFWKFTVLIAVWKHTAVSWVMSASLIWSQNVWQTLAIENRSVDISHNQSLFSTKSGYWGNNCRLQLRMWYWQTHYYYILWYQNVVWAFCVYWNVCEHSNLQLCRHSTVVHHLHPACNFQSVMTSVWGLAVEINFKTQLSKLATELKILVWLFGLRKNIMGCNWSVWSG